jgi:hypothetical protein
MRSLGKGEEMRITFATLFQMWDTVMRVESDIDVVTCGK